MSASDDRPQDPPAEGARRKGRGPLIAVAFAVVAILAVVGARYVMHARTHVTTDDAQVEGHVVPVLARVGGYVAAVRVEENQPVRAGDTLVVLDDRDLRARLQQAEGRLAAAQAVAGTRAVGGEAGARLAAARASVVQARAVADRARADLARYRELAGHHIISRQQLDQAVSASTAADAALAAAEDQVAAAVAGLRGAASQLEAARGARDEALLQLGYSRIVAPSDGVVSRKGAEVGQLVQPGQQLMSVVPLTDVWVVANLKETQLRDVDPGDAVDIRVDTDPRVKHAGEVESISPATGAKFSLMPPDNATGNFTKVVQRVPVRIRFTGAHDPAHPLRPGLSVKVTIRTKG